MASQGIYRLVDNPEYYISRNRGFEVIAERVFAAGHLSAVHGLRLVDGRLVVLRVRAGAWPRHPEVVRRLLGREFVQGGTGVIVAGLVGPPCLNCFQVRRRVKSPGANGDPVSG